MQFRLGAHIAPYSGPLDGEEPNATAGGLIRSLAASALNACIGYPLQAGSELLAAGLNKVTGAENFRGLAHQFAQGAGSLAEKSAAEAAMRRAAGIGAVASGATTAGSAADDVRADLGRMSDDALYQQSPRFTSWSMAA